MTTPRLSFTSARRPTSAIFIGVPPPPSPPSPARSSSSTHSQLPSPPATNSGSTGDSNSTSAGSIRRAGMPNGNKHLTLSDDDEDNILNHDEDDTAKLSNEMRYGKGKGADYNYSESTLQRVKSLTERNRKVIDRLSSITSPDPHSRSSLSTASAGSTTSSRSRSPLPPTFSSSSSSSTASSSSRVSFAHSLRGGSGSETEREQQHPDRTRLSSRDSLSHTPDENDAITPPASTRQNTPAFQPRQRLRSAPSSPAKPPATLSPNSPRKQGSTTFAVIGSGRRSRRVSIQQPDADDDDSPGLSHTVGGSAYKKSRAPLPREFRDRRSLDGRSVGESSISTQITQNRERTTSPGFLVARGAASPHSSGAGATFSATPTSPRAQRPARPSTVRDSPRRVQRWSSVDEVALNANGGSSVGEDGDGRRQWRSSGSAESPLGGREGRSVVGEGLRAAGLSRRGGEDVFVEGVPQRRTRISGGLGSRPSINGSRDGDLDELRRGITRAGLGMPEGERDTRAPPTASGSRYGTARNIHSISTASSRPGTSLASYGGNDEAPRTAPLRSSRSSFGLPSGTSARHTPQHDRSHSSPFGRNSATGYSQAPSSEHARLMLDSLSMFEAQLARIPSSSSAPDLTHVAQSVVQSAHALNSLLRAGNAHALEAQIEAEVGDAAAEVDASEVWRKVGGEYRENVRVSDELVRTVTALLLGVGRLVREVVKERGTESPDVGGGGRSGLDINERVLRAGRRSTDVDGRQSTEGSLYRESRRSLEDDLRRPRVDLNSRPSTALSMTRDRDRDGDRRTARDDDGGETARERERSSALDRLSTRRVFTPRVRDTAQDSPNSSFPSPSPASRDHHRSLPSLAVPPPLPSLPSESLLERKGSTRSRRAKFSNTSNATVRGTSIFPAINSPNPTTALTTHTVSAGGEVTESPILSSPSMALSGLQQQQERDVRTRSRTTSTASIDGASARVLRSSRARMSLDEAGPEDERSPASQSTPLPAQSDRRERRRTINTDAPL